MNAYDVELNNKNMTMGELELLGRLLSRLSWHYQGYEVRQRLCEAELDDIDNASLSVSRLIETYQEQGYIRNDILE